MKSYTAARVPLSRARAAHREPAAVGAPLEHLTITPRVALQPMAGLLGRTDLRTRRLNCDVPQLDRAIERSGRESPRLPLRAHAPA